MTVHWGGQDSQVAGEANIARPRRWWFFAIAMALIISGCSSTSVPAPASIDSRPDALSTLHSVHTGSRTPEATAAATGSPAGPAEVPYQADSLVDSIGVNTHFSGTQSSTNVFNIAAANLAGLGIRHIRDGWPAVGRAALSTKLQTLVYLGIHADLITYYGESASDIQSIAGTVTPALESYEAPNEYDCSGDPNWVVDLKTQIHTLYAAVGGGSLPVYGPAMCSAADYAAFGDQHEYMNDGNVHDYLSGYNPGTIGYGGQFAACGGVFYYGSIDFGLGCAEQVSGALSFTPSIAYPNPGSGSSFDYYTPNVGSKLVVSTENGYGTYPNTSGSVDAKTQAKYLPRLFLMQYAAGIVKSYWYELLDEGTPCPNQLSCFGLTSNNGATRKPAFYAMQGLISALADPGGSFTTTPFSYGFSGGPPTLAHMLFQKRNGQYILALWNETSSWNVNSGTGVPISVSPVSTTVNLPFAPKAVSANAFNDSGTFATVAPTVSGNNVTLKIDDHVSLITFSHP